MVPPLPLYASLQVLTLTSGVGALLLRIMHRQVFRLRAAKLAYGAVTLALFAAHAAWGVGLSHFPTSYWGAAIACGGLVLLIMFVASLPAAAVVRWLTTTALTTLAPAPTKPAEATAAPQALTRRALIHGATALVPATAVGLGIRGFAAASNTETPILPFVFPDLHPDLDGFTILHLSDLHLGISRNVADLERLLARLDGERQKPDLIVFTGDLAEDLRELAPALAAAHSFRAKHGVLACLGNHEYLRGIDESRPIYEASQVPLLVDRGTTLRVGGARLYVGGTNDPVAMHTDIRSFMHKSVESAMKDARASDFRMLLSHRPEGFDPAARAGVDLTLSGHTHGGQIGFNKKSAFEPLWPDGYLWGDYRRGPSRLYTTSGFGDWFPFRLGCPAEAPLLVLKRGTPIRASAA